MLLHALVLRATHSLPYPYLMALTPASTWPVLRAASALLAGSVFGLGLAMAQMTDPRVVQAFLDIVGAWDPRLLWVLGGAVLVAMLGFGRVLRRPAPQLDDHFYLPPAALVDRRLLAGAALFGLGWALAGYCPGPAIASLGQGNTEALWFVPAMLAGAGLQRWQAARVARVDRAAAAQ